MFQSAATTLVIAQSTTDTSTARCKPMTISRNVLGPKSGGTELIIIGTAFAPAIVSVAGQIYSEFLRRKQTRNYYALIGAEEQISSEAFIYNDDDCFYYHSWRNNVVITFGTLSSFFT